LLLSLRQDALAAKDVEPTPDNWLRLAGLLGHELEDWPTSLEMTFPRGSKRSARLTSLQGDPRYLQTAYPNPKDLKDLSEPLTNASWDIEGSRGLSQSILYSVIRHESRFYPRAISLEGALGLCQFMPRVFRDLDIKWGLLAESGVTSDIEYLFDPGRNTRLWARWVNAEFPIHQRDGLAMSLMKHQAGRGNVAQWSRYWNELGLEDDLEYRIETARFNATRNFVRRVLQDTAIVEATAFGETQREERAQ
jgi:hypothetical protein